MYVLHGKVLWALLDMNNFRHECLFSSAKRLVEGQRLALGSRVLFVSMAAEAKGQ